VGLSSTVDLRRWSGEEEVAVWREMWALVPSASCGFGKVQGFRVLSSLSSLQVCSELLLERVTQTPVCFEALHNVVVNSPCLLSICSKKCRIFAGF